MLFLKPSDSFRSTFGSGRSWRLAGRFFSTHARIEFADRLCRFQRKEKSACRVYIVELEVQALQPRVLPINAFLFHKHGKKPFLGDPIDAADQELRLISDGVQGEAPAFEYPVGFLILAEKITMSVLEKLILNVERILTGSIVHFDQPFLIGITRYLARCQDSVPKNQMRWQKILLQ